LQLSYNRAVTDPDRLNQYEPFSPEVGDKSVVKLHMHELFLVTVEYVVEKKLLFTVAVPHWKPVLLVMMFVFTVYTLCPKKWNRQFFVHNFEKLNKFS